MYAATNKTKRIGIEIDKCIYRIIRRSWSNNKARENVDSLDNEV